MRVLSPEAILHYAIPYAACGPVFGNLFEKITVGGQKKAEPGSETVHGVTPPDHFFAAGNGIGDDQGHLLGCIASGFAVVISGKADGIPSRDKTGTVFDGSTV